MEEVLKLKMTLDGPHCTTHLEMVKRYEKENNNNRLIKIN